MRKVLTVIMDGIGHTPETFGNAVHAAHTPNLNWLQKNAHYLQLFAHGTHVGLPSDTDMGNSEVGHNALGAGRIYDQGAKLVDESVKTGSIFKSKTWQTICKQINEDATARKLHLIGLLSDGNVHSHEQHLHALLTQAKKDGIREVRIHPLLDGRDVSERSAEVYVERLNELIAKLDDRSFNVKIASGGGRMTTTMDRYEADWSMVERGWNAHVYGQSKNQFQSIEQALAHFRKDPLLTDQTIPEFVIAESGKPVGPIVDGDCVIFFNFRGDRSIEISRAFMDETFDKFPRKSKPNVFYAGMMEYDGDLKIPSNFLVSPPEIENTLSNYLITKKVRQFACSETQKFGHVTYFWNGNRSGFIDKKYEDYLEISSDNISFDLKPWMKAYEITEATISKISNGSFDFGRINYPNGDMVGHTGNFHATVLAVQTVDLMIGRLIAACRATNTVLIVTADHGNADEMFDAKPKDFPSWSSEIIEQNIKPKTSHTLNPVPFYVFDPLNSNWHSSNQKNPGLGHVANTINTLLGVPESEDFLPSLLRNAK
jgi:2,3-bisphosphoglycerate-independent phosphoglycerate mutase